MSKITTQLLRKIVKEEFESVLKEEDFGAGDVNAKKKAIDAQIKAHQEQIKLLQSKISDLKMQQNNL